MNVIKLIRLQRSIASAAEAFRGVDMDTYTALISAGRSMETAIQSAEKLKKRQPLNPVPLDKLLGQKDQI